MNRPPEISESTAAERREYIKQRFRCIADCDMCGICAAFHGKDPEEVYQDYISGSRSFLEVSADHR